jgi:hypothetical protein
MTMAAAVADKLDGTYKIPSRLVSSIDVGTTLALHDLECTCMRWGC